MKYVLLTIAGVESIAKKEIEKQGGIIEEVQDRLVTFSGEENLIARINLWSRVGNKMYLLLDEKDNVSNFDEMFDIIKNINWKKYFKRNFKVMVKSSSVRSELFSARTIQSLGKKAIVNSLVGEGGNLYEDENEEYLEVLILIIDNKLRVLLNTSGQALHMRGYRLETGDAPIKESLAAALVLLSNWRFRENFYDPFCGSGTLAIEALMIAKNIAPGLKRRFAFEKLDLLSKDIIEEEKSLAKSKIFEGKYNIFASDIDPEMVEIAKANAARAGLASEISFSIRDFKEYLDADLNGTLVSNPPYGDRLKEENLVGMYNAIDKIFRINTNLGGGIISSYLEFDNLIRNDSYKKRKLYNGGEKCYFWKKK